MSAHSAAGTSAIPNGGRSERQHSREAARDSLFNKRAYHFPVPLAGAARLGRAEEPPFCGVTRDRARPTLQQEMPPPLWGRSFTNFGNILMKEGLTRIVNGLDEKV